MSAWRLAQLCIVYGAILAHVFVMAYTDPLQDSSFVMLLLLFRCVRGAASDCAYSAVPGTAMQLR